jgi:hypothetical protein
VGRLQSNRQIYPVHISEVSESLKTIIQSPATMQAYIWSNHQGRGADQHEASTNSPRTSEDIIELELILALAPHYEEPIQYCQTEWESDIANIRAALPGIRTAPHISASGRQHILNVYIKFGWVSEYIVAFSCL